MKENTTTRWILATLLVIAGIYLFTRPQQKTSSEKYAECTRTSGELYDISRQTITKNANGYSKDEQAVYYQRTRDAYNRDLMNCLELYK